MSQAEHLASTVPEYAGLPLRVYIEGKGCDGFYYGVTFAEQLPEDAVYEQGTLKILVDRESVQFLAGSTIQWVDDERGRGFLVDNPNHKKFRGKFFKRQAWVEKLTKTDPTATSSSQ